MSVRSGKEGRETHGRVFLGWFIAPPRVADRAIKALHVDLFEASVSTYTTRSGTWNAHMSLTLIGTPCNGPWSSPVLANSASSLRASSLASSKSTEKTKQRNVSSREWCEWQRGPRTFRQTIRRVLDLSSSRKVSFQHACGSPYFLLNILHNLRRCTSPNISTRRKCGTTGRLTRRVQVFLMLVCREGGCVLESLCATRPFRADGVAGNLRIT
jgi:hypothetical protein